MVMILSGLHRPSPESEGSIGAGCRLGPVALLAP